VALDVWEAQPRILNPLAEWSWADVTAFVDAEGVPVNPAHSYIFRSEAWIDPRERHRPLGELPWTKTDLGKPFWRATPEELAGTPPAKHAYVFKSFGDTHTT
jgi:3'-phosphoadenosine 5'-phosphosulfate sulfotransferase (PAPS reductase)/FAD synthetase